MSAPVAVFDGFTFPFNPNSVKWGYHLNTASYDTLGGRVTQVLSVNVQTMTWDGDAGSRERLIAIANKVAGTMLKQVNDGNPVRLVVPLKGWTLDVFAKSMPGLGWNLETVTFPYQLTLEVQDDYGTVGRGIIGHELSRLQEGIGYSGEWHGGTAKDFNDYQSSVSQGLGI